MKKIPDAQRRLRALDTHRSFCISAPAGSGKTELLAQRILALLAEANMPEEILAISFTRKAAGEMRDRLLHLLAEANDVNAIKKATGVRRESLELARSVLARDQQKNWGLLRDPARLQLGTIDGFCAWLSRCLPLLSGLGGALQIVDESTVYRTEAIHRLFGEMEEEKQTATALETLLHHLDNDRSSGERFFDLLLMRRLQWLRQLSDITQREILQQGISVVRNDLLLQARSLLWEQRLKLTALAEASVGEDLQYSELARLAAWVAAEDPAQIPEADQNWQILSDLLLTAKGTWRTGRGKMPLGGKLAKKALRELLEAVSARDPKPLEALRRLPEQQVSAQQIRLLETLSFVLRRLCAHLQLVFREHGKIDHSGVTLAALEALGAADAPSELALALGCRIRHILVDEFQDTSEAQWRLLEQLTRGWMEHNEQDPTCPHTLFLVGDGMQSCYRFRDANVGLFLRAREQGLGGMTLEDLELQCNFRSGPSLVEWCNRNFSRVFPQSMQIDTGAVPFIHASAVRDALDGEKVRIQLFCYEKKEEMEQAKGMEAQKIAQLVRSIHGQNPETEIAILLRSRSHARHIVPALQMAGIPFRSEEMDPLVEQPLCQDLLSLSCALLDPWDRFSWLAILRAPWCGLEKTALHLLAGEGEEQHRAALWPQLQQHAQSALLGAEDRQRLQRFCTALQPAIEGRARRSLRRQVEGVWLALGGPAIVGNRAELRHAHDFFVLLEECEQEDLPLSATLLEERIAKLYAAPEHPEAHLQLMTIHKAKGLEFDTVIVPALERSTQRNSGELLLGSHYFSEDGGDYPLFAVRSAPGEEPGRLYRWLEEREKQSADLELQRLFYVACTRAVRRLYLSACVKSDAETSNGWRRPAKDSMAHILWRMGASRSEECELLYTGAEEPRGEKPEEKSLAIQTEPSSSGADLYRLPLDWNPPAVPKSVRRPVAGSVVLPAAQQEPLQKSREGMVNIESVWVRQIGIVLHSALEKISADVNFLSDTGEQHKIRSLIWRAQLRQLGVPASAMKNCLERIEEGVHKVLADPRGQWLLSSEREQGAAELALQYLDDEDILRSIRVDRCFVEEGVRWIIDYKSGAPRPGQSTEDFLAEAEQRYAPQLQKYAEIFRQLEPARPVRTALYFPMLPQWHALKT